LKLFIYFMAVLLAAGEVMADTGQLKWRICNRDSAQSVAVAFVDVGSFGETTVEGWWKVAPNSCDSFYRYSSEYGTNGVYFGWDRKLHDLDFGSLNRGRKSYCVDPINAIDIFDSVLITPGRSRNCVGKETLARPSFMRDGAPETTQELYIGPFPDKPASPAASDDQICVFGYCF
jgi:Protein of unknown function (DUF1036)